jgi:hypothetical protein
VSSLLRLLNRIKLHRDVFGVYSKVDILYYSQNGKMEGLHLKNAMLLNETYQGQFALGMQSVPLQNNRHSFDLKDGDVRTQAATAANQPAAANHSARGFTNSGRTLVEYPAW